MNNPFWNAYRKRRQHERSERVWWFAWLRLLPVWLGLSVLSFMAQPVWLSFLTGPQREWSAGVQGAFMRLGLVLVGIQAIRVYGVLIRGSERTVLTLLPVDPSVVGAYQTKRVGRESVSVLLGAWLMLSPIGFIGDWLLWGCCVVAVAGLWYASLNVSAVIHLFAVGVARSPKWQPILDLVRGSNPREQAAFIYAPGVVLLALGVLVSALSWGVTLTWQGVWLGWVMLIAPWAVGLVFGRVIPAVSKGGWYQATSVLADIDARYGVVMENEEALRVYMDWTLRFIPVPVARWALKDMRYGWRSQRTWVALTWLVGLLGVISGWTTHPTGPLRVVMVTSLGLAVFATLAVLMTRDEPEELRRWLGDGGLLGVGGRSFVLWTWSQAAILPGVFALWIRFGVWEAVWVCAATQAIGLGFVNLAILSSWLKKGRFVAYISCVTLGLSGLSAVFFGG